MPTRTTSTATLDAPVEISFRCPKCGTDVSITRYMRMSAEASVRHYAPERAEAAARSKLAANADKQLLEIAEAMKKNRAILRGSKDQISARTIPFKCPNCGIISIPDAGCKRRMLTPKWFAPFFIAILTAVWVFILLIGSDLLQVPSRPLGYIAVALAGALLVTLALVFIRKRSDSAYSDPALLEKRFRSVLNDAVYAELTPYGLERIHMGSEA